MRSLRARASVLLLALGLAAPARAESPLDLRWHAPPSCPDLRTVQTKVRAWLAPGAAGVDAGGVFADARIEGQEGDYLLTLELRATAGEERQRVRATSCDTLVNLVALKVALAADTRVASEHTPSAPPARLPTTGRLRGHLRLVLGSGARVLPGLAPELAAFGGVTAGLFALELGGAYLLPRDRSYADVPSVGGRFDAWDVEARLCLVPTLGRSQLPVCVGGLLGMMRAEGYGTARSRPSLQPWAALPWTLGFRWPGNGRWALWAELSTLLAVLRPQYSVRGLGQLYRPDRVGVRLQLGGELHFR